MRHVINYTYNSDTFSYMAKKKFDSGNTVEIEFFLAETQVDGPMYVQIGLRSFTKRKQRDQPDFEFRTTGRDALEPAIWATQCLLEFPQVLFADWQDKDKLVYEIYWSDAKRRDVYHKWLSRYGFYFDHLSGVKCLSRVFSR